ncbi:hypothetical protein [Plantibacter sp. YIM 135347]|uniref:hypothetical protein n=1 Tax=Plantibacter sp. YIM 135347 TaxID=3423919 RepID=UPI003D34BD72
MGKGTKKRRMSALAGALAVIGALALTGCQQTSGSADLNTSGERLAGSLVEMFEQKLETQTNTFVIAVLERAIGSGAIEQADYDEAHRLYRQCMEDAGYQETFEQQANGVVQITPPKLSGEDAVKKYMRIGSECSDELAPIESLFVVQQGNPDLLAEPEEVVARCLVKAGLVDTGYAADDFRVDLDQAFAGASFDPSSDAAQTCFSGAGYAIKLER